MMLLKGITSTFSSIQAAVTVIMVRKATLITDTAALSLVCIVPAEIMPVVSSTQH